MKSRSVSRPPMGGVSTDVLVLRRTKISAG